MDKLPDCDKIEAHDCFCESCVFSKMTKLRFKKKGERKTTQPLELVHFDIFGDLKPHGLNGERFVLVLVDDYTRAVWAIPLLKKSDLRKKIKTWIPEVETRWSKQAGKTLRVGTVRSDNAGENTSKSLSEFLLMSHISHERTVPGCSKSNGIAERAIGVLAVMVRHSLLHMRLPILFWSEAFKSAANVRNRMPNHANPDSKSPFEMLTGKKPSWESLRTFGAPCYSFLNYSERKVAAWYCHPTSKGKEVSPKLLQTAEKGIYMGPSTYSKGWRIYLPGRGRVLVRRHVIFDERPQEPLDVLDTAMLRDNPMNKRVTRGRIPLDHRKLLGTPIVKLFENDAPPPKMKEYRGEVVDIDVDTATGDVIYGVCYDDGDSEDMTWKDLQDCIADDMPEPLPPDSSDSEEEDAESEEEKVGKDSEEKESKTKEVGDVEFQSADSGEESVVLPKDPKSDSAGSAEDSGEEAGEEATPPRRYPKRRNASGRALHNVKSYMAYFGKALFAFAALHVPSTSAHLGAPHVLGKAGTEFETLDWQANRLHSEIPYLHEEMQAKADAFMDSGENTGDALWGRHWVFVANGETGVLDGVMARDVPVPKNEREALKPGKYQDHWQRSIATEIRNMEDNEVWEITKAPLPMPKLVNTMWVFKCKSNADGSIDKFKARLCAKGYTQVQGVDFNETFAPVVRGPTLRFQLADAVRRGLTLDQIDFEAAFLQSPIDGDVYLRAPAGTKVPRGYVLKLKKGMYGLKQAAFLWNRDLNKLLSKQGFKQSTADPCLWILDNKEGYISVSTWVDDCVVAYNNKAQWSSIIKELAAAYPMSASGKLEWCLGMKVRVGRNRRWIEINQTKYINDMMAKWPQLDQVDVRSMRTPGVHGQSLAKADIPDGARELTGQKPYRELLGQLNYLACWTRPDICTNLSLLARFQNNYWPIHWKALTRVALYVKLTKAKVIRFEFPKGAEDNPAMEMKINLVGYVDADYAADKDNSNSRTGYVFMLCGAPIVWRSALQGIVAQSTCESEYVAANAVAREAEWCRLIYDELCGGDIGVDGSKPLRIQEDNQSCIALAKKFIVSRKTKHIRVRYHYVRQQVRDGIIALEYIRSADNTADLFTKALKEDLFMIHRDALVKDPLPQEIIKLVIKDKQAPSAKEAQRSAGSQRSEKRSARAQRSKDDARKRGSRQRKQKARRGRSQVAGAATGANRR